MKKVFYICFGVFVLSGCGNAQDARKDKEQLTSIKYRVIINQIGLGIYTFCDQGRAIYIYNQNGGIAVIPNAKECQ